MFSHWQHWIVAIQEQSATRFDLLLGSSLGSVMQRSHDQAFLSMALIQKYCSNENLTLQLFDPR